MILSGSGPLTRIRRIPCNGHGLHSHFVGRLSRQNSSADHRRNATVSSSAAEIHVDIAKKLFDEAYLENVCKDLGRTITADYTSEGIDQIMVLGVLKGAFVFTADLVRHLRVKYVEVDFIRASSYGSSTVSSGSVEIEDGFKASKVEGKHVLIVEDIIDSGLTLSSIVASLATSGVASVKVVTLLDKRARRKVEFNADYVGIPCPDDFIVGYGIDYAEKYRHLPYVGVIKPEAI
eukprot:gene15278-21359_t